MTIFIGSISAARQSLEDVKYDVAVSIADPGQDNDRPVNLGLVPKVLRMSFKDKVRSTETADLFGPAHAKKLVGFLRGALDDGADRFLFHCFAGHSRSTAAAMVLLYLRYGTDKLVDRLLAIQPAAVPNTLVVRLCEDELRLADRPISSVIDQVDQRSTAPVALLRHLQNS